MQEEILDQTLVFIFYLKHKKKLILDSSPQHKMYQEVRTISEYSPHDFLRLYLHYLWTITTMPTEKRTHEAFIKKDKSGVTMEDFPGEILRKTCIGTTDYSKGSLLRHTSGERSKCLRKGTVSFFTLLPKKF